MPLFPPQAYRNTDNTHRQGERADQPLATDVLPGTLYFIVDEGITERSDGTAWSAFSGAGSRLSYVVNYSYSANQFSPPGTNQVRFNAGYPYTAVTKLYFWNVTADGQDVRIGLMRVSPGSLIYVQDKNDNTQYATFLTTAFPTDHTTWVEYDVTHYAHGNSIGGGQLVLVQSTWGPTTNPTYTPGSVPFAGAGGTLTEDNSNFFFDDSTDRLKVGGSVLTPTVLGGTGTGSDLTLQATSGVGDTTSKIFLNVADNGAAQVEVLPLAGNTAFPAVGIGTPGLYSPVAPLNIYGPGPDIGYLIRARAHFGGAAEKSGYIQVESAGGGFTSALAGFTFHQTSNEVEWRMAVSGGESNAMRWYANQYGIAVAEVVLYVTVRGNFVLNTSLTEPATGTKCFIFGDGTVPATMAADTAGLYADDIAGAVNMFAINENGVTAQLTGKPDTFVTKSGTQSISDSTLTAVSFDQESYDVGPCHDNSTNNSRLTVPAGCGGTYLIVGGIEYTSSAVGIRLARLRKNGSGGFVTVTVNAVTSDATIVQVTALQQLAAGDYVELIAYQTSTISLNALTGGTSLSWVKVL